MTRPHSGDESPKSQRSVLDSVAARTGEKPKVMLTDQDSEYAATPVLSPPQGEGPFVPEGRDNYQVLGEIARGGMGIIMKGHDTDLGRDVALKVLDEKLAKRPEVVQRFVEEAQIGGQLQHPGIVPVYELGLMADERPYFTMKLIKGRTLSALLQQRRSTQDQRARLLTILASVCQTVAYAHSKGVLHRDLKPANIMIGAFGEVMVVDWGLAKVLNRGGVADERRAKHDKSMMTVIETIRSGPGSSGSDSLAGSVMGTPAYMAPEQAQGEIEKLDERADVFSLGAILCEILTGRPPYDCDESEGEHTLLQAARAQLDPARERVETCDADDAIKQLCLECLTPARAVRPANAGAVAQAIQDFQTGSEERAHEAKLVAETAQIKTREARRRLALVLALAGTLLAGGAGYLAIEKQREARRAQTHAAIEDAQGESRELRRAGQTREALDAARLALALAENGSVGEKLLERSRTFAAEAEHEFERNEIEATQLAMDEQLRTTLEQLRLDRCTSLGDVEHMRQVDALYGRAFREYGTDLESDDAHSTLEHFREREIATEVAIALDDWAFVQRETRGRRSQSMETLVSIAIDLDPDSIRRRLRLAILEGDYDTLLELAQPDALHRLPPGSIWVLTNQLWNLSRIHHSLIYRMYDQATFLYPDSLIMQVVGGMVYQRAGRHWDAANCWSAALSLRPDDQSIRTRLADMLYFSGQLTRAMGACRATLASDPDNPDEHYNLGMVYLSLGNYEAARMHLARSIEFHSPAREPQVLASRTCDLASVLYFLGERSPDEIVVSMEKSQTTLDRATYASALLDHPDPAQRRPQAALRVAEEIARSPEEFEKLWVVVAVARLENGDYAGARKAVKGRFDNPGFLVLSPLAIEFMRAVILSKSGDESAARECYFSAMAWWNEFAGGSVDAWANSDATRWRERAERVLGI